LLVNLCATRSIDTAPLQVAFGLSLGPKPKPQIIGVLARLDITSVLAQHPDAAAQFVRFAARFLYNDTVTTGYASRRLHLQPSALPDFYNPEHGAEFESDMIAVRGINQLLVIRAVKVTV
jgi:hypothetical protein